VKKLLPLTTPGEILSEELLKPLGLSEYKLAQALGIPRVRINSIVRGTRAITADTAYRLGQYFGMSPRFWLNLQADYDLRRLERETELPKIPRCSAMAAEPVEA
jgi:addiction module HigA family antidote